LPGPASSSTVYEPVALWGRIPHGIYFKDATAAAVDDDRDRVYVFNRGNHPMVVLNKAGEYVESWGQGDYIRPHGVTVDPEGNLFLADDLDHTIKKTDPYGNVIFTLGTRASRARGKRVERSIVQLM
jgi:DNA-binding beta-propeller fold protein YncE